MMQVRIYDMAFAYTTSLGTWGIPTYFSWCRDKQCKTHNPNLAFFTDICLPHAEICPEKHKIAWILEPPSIRQDFYNYAINSQLFEYILTYDMNLVDNKRILYYSAGGCWIRGPGDRRGQPYDIGLHPKSKIVSIIASEKQWLPGHKIRHLIISKYPQIVAFGNAVQKPIDNKADGLRDFMFSIVVENTRLDDLFTEKLVDCFATGTIPVYWGTQNIGNYFNQDGIIQLDIEVTYDEQKVMHFDMAKVDEIIHNLSPELYISKLAAIQDNYERHFKYRIPEDRLWEQYPFIFNIQ